MSAIQTTTRISALAAMRVANLRDPNIAEWDANHRAIVRTFGLGWRNELHPASSVLQLLPAPPPVELAPRGLVVLAEWIVGHTPDPVGQPLQLGLEQGQVGLVLVGMLTSSVVFEHDLSLVDIAPPRAGEGAGGEAVVVQSVL